jgi:hypothetical protein
LGIRYRLYSLKGDQQTGGPTRDKARRAAARAHTGQKRSAAARIHHRGGPAPRANYLKAVVCFRGGSGTRRVNERTAFRQFVHACVLAYYYLHCQS